MSEIVKEELEKGIEIQGEKYEGEIAYIVSDELLQEASFEYFIRPSGAIGYNEDTRCIWLE